MTMEKVFLLSLAAGAVTAMPSGMTDRDSRYTSLSSRDDGKPENSYQTKDDFCNNWDLLSEDGAWEMLDKTATIYQLDQYIATSNQAIEGGSAHHWMWNYANLMNATSTDSSAAGGCDNVDTDCNPGRAEYTSNCDKTYDDYYPMMQYVSSFYIYRAVKLLHEKMAALKGDLIDSTIFTMLELDSMISDLGAASSTGSDMMAWVQNAVSLGTTALSYYPPGAEYAEVADEAMGITSEVFGTIAGGTEDITGDIKEGLGQAFQSVANQIDWLLRTATGMSEDVADYDALPKFHTEENWKTNIGAFFANGWISTISDGSELTDSVRNSTISNLMPKTAHQINAANGWALMIDFFADYEDASHCGYGQEWMDWEGTSTCVGFTAGDDTEKFPAPASELFESLTKYGLGKMNDDGSVDMSGYYSVILECAKSSQTNLDAKAMPIPGVIPQCWYPMDVYKTYKGDTSCGIGQGCPAGGKFRKTDPIKIIEVGGEKNQS